jgi:hypothetical protein
MTAPTTAAKLIEPKGTNNMLFAASLVLLVVLIEVLIENLIPVGLATVRVRRK